VWLRCYAAIAAYRRNIMPLWSRDAATVRCHGVDRGNAFHVGELLGEDGDEALAHQQQLAVPTVPVRADDRLEGSRSDV